MSQNSKQQPLKLWRYARKNKGAIGTCSFLGIIVITVIVTSVQANNWATWTGLGSREAITTTTVTKQDSDGNVIESSTVTSTPGKTFWDWLSLLGVPLSLAVLGYWFQQQQKQREQDASEKQQKIANEQAAEDILQDFFDRLSTLLIGQNILAIPTKDSLQPDEQELIDTAIDIIRARTLSVLRRFKSDKARKTSVIKFLIDTEIIDKAKLSLRNANLSNVDLRSTNLSGADLSNADLSNADLSNADLSNADLSKSILANANFIRTNLSSAKLTGAQIFNTDFTNSQLDRADFSSAYLSDANLNNTNLSDINLSKADLNSASFIGANLESVQLNTASFSIHQFKDAVLNDIDLDESQRLTLELYQSNLDENQMIQALREALDNVGSNELSAQSIETIEEARNML